MGKIKQKKPNNNKKPTRKELRKEKRTQKKVKKNDYFTNLNKPGKFVKAPAAEIVKICEKLVTEQKKTPKVVEKVEKPSNVPTTEQVRKKEQKEQKKLEAEMQKQRNRQLLEANREEDKNIKSLEKQLKLNKRKTKNIPKSFSTDGLDYLLEVCDSETMESAVKAEQQFSDFNNDFDEDLALISGKNNNRTNVNLELADELDDFEQGFDDDDVSDEETFNEEDFNESSESEVEVKNKKRKIDEAKKSKKKKHKQEIEPKEDFSDNQDLSDNNESDFGNTDDEKLDESVFDEESDNENKSRNKTSDTTNETWQDIYGRTRGKDGAVLDNKTETEVKYIPPALRNKLTESDSTDKIRQEKLNKLKKQLKGLLNRLAESNMHNVATQIEDLYMRNSRNDMNDSLTSLIFDALVTNVLTPERLLMEHILLITVLHANIGTEIGAHFLQTTVKKFDELHQKSSPIENKTLDNVVRIIAQMYNFKIFDAKLMYEILDTLSRKFEEKQIDCILHVLRDVGFNLRKDDPLALKNLILTLQKNAAVHSEQENARVRFLLDILLAIKNNNVSKIPNYDNTYSEHLKKIMKGFIRKGNYVTQLNITVQDLLSADEKGRWWVVGSAWVGNTVQKEKTQETKHTFSQKLLELARKQRMNTDTRRNIFCIIMSAEDYLDAFEKLLHLGLKNNQEREIIHVILHCCLQEKQYNPYYSILAQKLCDHDRKYQMTIKFSVWDKLKSLSEQSGSQMANLAKLLTHLFIEKGLSISTLKVVQFSELDKVSLRFMRQILLGILLHEDQEASLGVFENVARSDKLKMFRESLRLFIHHFLLKNINVEMAEKQRIKLVERAKLIEKLLSVKDSRTRF